MPLTGSTGQDLGFRFDNNLLDNTDFASTDIEGDAVPDWDIELYRNDILIATQTVDQNGRYRFEDIQLFIGANNFELFFFGPQGEIRIEELSVPVNQELLSSQDNTYEVSVSFEDTQTYQENVMDDEDRNQPHIAAKFNKLIGGSTLGFLGFRTNQISGDRKYYATTGISSTIGQTLVDANLAVDESGEMAAEAILRRRLAGWDLSFNAVANTDEYITSETEDPEVLRLGFNAQRVITPLGIRTNLLTSGLYQETADGAKSSDYSLGFSNNIYNTNISNRINYESNKNIDSSSDERIDHIFSVRRSFGKYFLRLGTAYEISPDSRFRNIVGQVNYRHDNTFSGDLTFDRQLITDIDTTRLNLNYNHDSFRLSPFFQYNSDDEVIAGVSLNFSLTDDPTSPFPDFDDRRYVNRGALSAFVYHDKDGNLIFDGEDEPVERAVVESVNFKRRVPTDAQGFANIKDLSTNKATDIILDPETLPDPFMIPATGGNSILPDPGSLYEMEFPVHLTGEVEGHVYITDDNDFKTPASYHTVVLRSLDKPDREPLEARTERDGFYVLFRVPPGDYIMNTADKNGRFGNDIPQYITIGYDGTIVKDIDFNISRSNAYVPYEIVHGGILNEAPVLRIHNKGQSELSQTLGAIIRQQNHFDPYRNLVGVRPFGDDTSGHYYSADSLTLESAHQKCQDIIMNGMSCTVLIN
jgi:hypothetical protein